MQDADGKNPQGSLEPAEYPICPLIGHQAYNSVLERNPLELTPPVTNTPLFSSVAVCEYLEVFSEAVAAHVPLAGLYNSALETELPEFWPPKANTSPLGSKIVVKAARGEPMEPVAVHVPVAGLYNCALER